MTDIKVYRGELVVSATAKHFLFPPGHAFDRCFGMPGQNTIHAYQRCYEVVVIGLDEDQEFPTGPEEFPTGVVLDWETCKAKAGCVYSAMVLNENELKELKGRITIGANGTTTCNDANALPAGCSRRRRAPAENRGAYNGELQPGTSYTAFTRAYIPIGGGEVEKVSSPLMDVITTDTSESSVGVVTIAIGVAVAILVCIIVVAVFFLWRRRQRIKAPVIETHDTLHGNDNTAFEMKSARKSSGVNDAQSLPLTFGHKRSLPSTPTDDTYTEPDSNHDDAENPYNNVGNYEYAIEEEDDSWEISWDSLMLGTTILGKGNFGEVREGVVWKNNKAIKVAVKFLKDGASLIAKKDFMDEFGTMTKIGSHPNIVTLIGACENKGILYVALELIPHGNLRSYLRQIRQDGSYVHRSEQLMKFAMDVANGMKHLENIGIIHRDLAARNVLLGNDYIAKVSDFGLSRDEDMYVKKSKTRVPIRWMAPESIQFSTYTSKSDVWSFGVLLWEIGSLGGTPYAKIVSKDIISMLRDGYRMPKPDKCVDDMYEVMTNCWQFEADLRPTFRELHRSFNRMLEENMIYMAVEPYENAQLIELAPINTDLDDR
ncbi:uncharacterized protein [Amphiura filiformis]|uniref:uncharacterized protein n=1 Tax=Amphiura filiformis TaxID=82378 RepID=UPI003B20B722